MNTYVAVDIGASSGRLLVASLVDGKIKLKEIHRFKNGFFRKGLHDVWDSEFLLNEIVKGLEKVKKSGFEKCVMGIDTWAVDYALLNEKDELIHEIVSYRDQRTENAVEKIKKKISTEEIYKKTGIQFQQFNTLFQLYVEEKRNLEKAKSILLVPDYLTFRLTGIKKMEKTNASTMQLMNLETGELDETLLQILNLNREQFPDLVEAGTGIGMLKKENFPDHDLPSCEVIAVGTHDTASAVAGTPGLGDSWAFLSSGTWSLLGMELNRSIGTKEAFKENYTNEAGVYDTNRFLKNIMGLWMVQEVSRKLETPYTFSELAQLAELALPFQQKIDINDSRFLNPENMIEEIQAYCKETNQVVPFTTGEIIRSIYDNLARSYQQELKKLSKLTGKSIKELIIVGGGANVSLLNQMIADLTGITVWAGPSEATALGNLIVQMIAKEDVRDLNAGRKLIYDTYPMRKFESTQKQRMGEL